MPEFFEWSDSKLESLPNSKQESACISITLPIPVDFGAPEQRPRLRDVAAHSSTMPKATGNENGGLLPCKEEIRPASKSGCKAHPLKICADEGHSQTQLGGFVVTRPDFPIPTERVKLTFLNPSGRNLLSLRPIALPPATAGFLINSMVRHS